MMKNLTLLNLISGFTTLIVVSLLRYSGIVPFTFYYFDVELAVHSEYIILGFIGLITRLGLKGIVEEYIPHTDNMMTIGNNSPEGGKGSGDNLPIESKGKGLLGVSSGSSSTGGVSAPEDNLGDKAKGSSSQTSTSTSYQDPTNSNLQNIGSKRRVNLFNRQLERIHLEIKDINIKLKDCNNEADRSRLEDELSEAIDNLSLLTKGTSDELSKTTGLSSENSTVKRGSEDVNPQSSKKR